MDGSATEERCLEWPGIWQRSAGAPWQIDIIHIESGSTFDGYFARFADRLCRRLDAATRDTILRLK